MLRRLTRSMLRYAATTAASARSTASASMRSAGELVVLLGANGAGKSSIFLATSGLQQAQRRQHPLRRPRTGRA